MCLQPAACNIDWTKHGLQILGAVMDLSPLSVVITDRSGQIVYVNPAFELASGYTAEEAIGKNPRILKSGLMDDRVYADLWARITSGQTWTGRMLNRRKDGTQYWENSTISPLIDDNGAIHHFVAMKRDVTQELLAAQAADEAHGQLERLAEQSGKVAWETDCHGLFTTACPVCHSVWGRKAEELVGQRSLADLFPEASRDRSRAEMSGVFERKEPVVNALCKLEKPGGAGVWVIRNAVPILGKEGDLLGYSGTDKDVTRMQETEFQLQESRMEVRRKLLSIHAPEEDLSPLVLTDLIDIEVMQSMLEGFRQITGIGVSILDMQGEILVATGFQDLCADFHRKHPESLLQCLEDYRSALAECRPGEIRRRRCTNNLWEAVTPITVGDQTFGCMMLGPFLFDDEEVDAGVFACQAAAFGFDEKAYLAALDQVPRLSRQTVDIAMDYFTKFTNILSTSGHHAVSLERSVEKLKRTEANLSESLLRAEELAEKAQASTRAKSEFLAMISHELRTPLNGVLGFADLLADYPMETGQIEAVHAIRECGEHLLGVVNEILDYSSIKHGATKIEEAPFDLAALLESSCAPLRAEADSKGLLFEVQCASRLPKTVVGDVRRIRQILLNLLGNAVKFTDSGRVVLRVGLAWDSNQPFLEFAVEDTGGGIPENQVHLLFEPFQQVDMSPHRKFQGTGLGLAISKRLADAMGGGITLTTRPGEGCVFVFRLPIGFAGEQIPDSITQHPAAQEPSFEPIHKWALVVEDDAHNSLLINKILTRLGYAVQVASNGLEAVHFFVNGNYDVILMDMQMPVMDGIKATKTIRNLETDTRIPIIALTANVLPGERERCMEAGMDAFLAKPFRKSELADLLDALVPLPG